MTQENNIFKGAKLGDKFKLSTGLFSIYIGDASEDCDGGKHYLYDFRKGGSVAYRPNGKPFPSSIFNAPDAIENINNSHELDIEGLRKYADKQVKINPLDTLNDIYIKAFIEGYKASQICSF